MLSRRNFCLCCIGTAFLPVACDAHAPAYRSTLNDGITPSPLAWAGRKWRCNMGSTWNRSMDHCLRLADSRARFEIRPTPNDRSKNDDAPKLRSELSGSLPGSRERLPNGVALWGATSFIHHRWADPAGMAERTGGVHGQIHIGKTFGGSPALAFRRNKRGEFAVTTRGEHDPESRVRHVGALPFDQVHDLVYRLVLDPSDGALAVWLDGRQIVDVRGQSIGSQHAESYWAVGCYYAGGASCPVVAEYANHVYPAPVNLSGRIRRRPAWPA
jgi:hypothetical protein